jgi:hypothetical protein
MDLKCKNIFPYLLALLALPAAHEDTEETHGRH